MVCINDIHLDGTHFLRELSRNFELLVHFMAQFLLHHSYGTFLVSRLAQVQMKAHSQVKVLKKVMRLLWLLESQLFFLLDKVHELFYVEIKLVTELAELIQHLIEVK